jgi:hypothetical protein
MVEGVPVIAHVAKQPRDTGTPQQRYVAIGVVRFENTRIVKAIAARFGALPDRA